MYLENLYQYDITIVTKSESRILIQKILLDDCDVISTQTPLKPQLIYIKVYKCISKTIGFQNIYLPQL